MWGELEPTFTVQIVLGVDGEGWTGGKCEWVKPLLRIASATLGMSYGVMEEQKLQ